MPVPDAAAIRRRANLYHRLRNGIGVINKKGDFPRCLRSWQSGNLGNPDAGAFSGAGFYSSRVTHLAGPETNIPESITLCMRTGIKTLAVIGNGHTQAPFF